MTDWNFEKQGVTSLPLICVADQCNDEVQGDSWVDDQEIRTLYKILQVVAQQKIKGRNQKVRIDAPKKIISSSHHWQTISRDFFTQKKFCQLLFADGPI